MSVAVVLSLAGCGDDGATVDPSTTAAPAATLASATTATSAATTTTAGPTSTTDPTDPAGWLALGVEGMGAEDWSAAVDLLTTVIDLAPEMAEPYLLRGMALLELQDYEAALADLDAALDLDPGLQSEVDADAYPRALTGLVDELLSAREIEAAEEEYTALIERYPDHPAAYLGRSRTQRMGQHVDWNGALADLDRAIELEPDDPVAHYERALTLDLLEDYDAAIAALTTALDLDPEYADAYDLRGFVYSERLGRPDLAIADYQAALEYFPDLPGAGFRLGKLLYEQGDYRGAISQLTVVIESEGVSNASLAFRYRGLAWKALGYCDLAIADLEQSVAEFSDARTHFEIGECHAEMGNHAWAVESFSAAIDHDPNQDEYWDARGRSQFELGNEAEARADQAEAERLRQGN